MLMLLIAAFVMQLVQAPPVPAQQQQQQQPPKATAVIRGRVIAGDTGQPARRAQVRLIAMRAPTSGSGPGGTVGGLYSAPPSVTVDADGRYEFTGLTPGRYTLTATRNGYIAEPWGATDTNTPGKPIDVQEGQVIDRVDFALIRGSVITGRIYDEVGDPISGVQVAALRGTGPGDQRFIPNGRQSTTDDLGQFRVYGLTPGTYIVQAQWRQNNPNGAEALGRLGYAPTYFPGTVDAPGAQRFTLRANQNVSDIVMSLVPVTTVKVSGSIIDSHGAAVTSGAVLMRQTTSSDSTVMNMMVNGTAPLRDGKFLFPNVAPGSYTLQRMAPNPADGESVSMDLFVGNDDITDLQLITSPPLKVSGRIVADPGVGLPPAPPALALSPIGGQNSIYIPGQNGNAAADFTFELKASPGTYRLDARSLPPPWSIRAIRVGMSDVTDTGIEVKPGKNVSGVEVELTNRMQTINGTVSGSAEQLKDCAVIVFPSDAAKTKTSRYIRVSRPGADGRFVIASLPPGDYHIVGLDHYAPGPTPSPEFLERQRPNASSITLLEGETRTIDLRLNSVSE
jgi:hypothetical protein